MFTIFQGFHLVEAYHQWKKDHRKNKNPLGLKALKLFFRYRDSSFPLDRSIRLVWIAGSEPC